MMTRHTALCLVALALPLVGCSSPTAPSALVPTAVNLPLDDPNFDRAFYDLFTQPRGLFFRPQSLVVYVMPTDNLNQPIPAQTLAQAIEAARSLQEALDLPQDVRMIGGSNYGQAISALTIYWDATTTINPNGQTAGGQHNPLIPGSAFINYKLVTYDICGGLAVSVVRHELMHAMGFNHTDRIDELMAPDLRYCDILPSARERLHAKVALSQPRTR